MRGVATIVLFLAACGGSSKPAPVPVDNDHVDTTATGETCNVLAQIIAAAPGGFASIKGEPVPDRPPEGYADQTTISLPGGTCEIYDIAQVSFVSCDMTGAYGDVKRDITACMDGWHDGDDGRSTSWDSNEGTTGAVSDDIDGAGNGIVHVTISHPDDDYEEPME